MQKWCAPYVLEPFGIDVDGNAIRMAELMFPTYPGHFFQCDIRKMGSFSPLPIPPQFSYVFCSLLGPGADESAGESFVSTALSLLRRRVADGGRLVLGFYGASHSQLGSAQQVIERSALIGYVSQFYRYGLMLDRIVPNPAGSNHVVAWCDDCGT